MSKGIGIHKHGVSGRTGTSPRYKLNRMLEANRESEQQQNKRKRPSLKQTVKEAFKKNAQ